jgi:hypothetical protein
LSQIAPNPKFSMLFGTTQHQQPRQPGGEQCGIWWNTPPKQADALNVPIALWFQVEHPWRRH